MLQHKTSREMMFVRLFYTELPAVGHLDVSRVSEKGPPEAPVINNCSYL